MHSTGKHLVKNVISVGWTDILRFDVPQYKSSRIVRMAEIAPEPDATHAHVL